MKETRPKVLLILGGGQMQLPAIRIAHRKGWRVIVADGSAAAPGAALADRFEQVDLKDREGMARMALRCRDEDGLDGVFTAGTDFSTTVAWVAEKCGLPGIPYGVAQAATDKRRMRELFKASGIPCPDFVGMAAGENPEDALRTLSLPLVVKPVDSMGARGVRRVNGVSELCEAFETAVSTSRTSQAILEAYMEGPELSLDAVIYRGKPTVCGVADRHIFFPPYFVEMGHTMPSALEPKILAEAEDLFRRGIAVLGITGGAAKGDIKLTPEGPMIGEIAARLSGGYMSGWTFPYSSGVPVTEAAMNVAVGLPPGDLGPRKHEVSAERAFLSIPGRIAEIAGIEEAGELDCLEDVFTLVREGDAVTFPTNNVQKCGNVISRAASREDAISAAEEAVRTVVIRLEPGNPSTDAFLSSRSEDDWLNGRIAFPLADRENRNAVDAMPPFWGKPRSRMTALTIRALPALAREETRDWHGMSIGKAVEKVLRLTGVRLSRRKEPGKVVLGSLFWRCLLKGGVQGGLYCIDAIAAGPAAWSGLLRREDGTC